MTTQPMLTSPIFILIPGHDIYTGTDGVPWQVFQMFFRFKKVDFLFGVN